METPLPSGTPDIQLLKLQASELQDQSRTSGTPLTRSQALEAVARLHGFRDWNAAVAASKGAKPAATPAGVQPVDWRDITQPLPDLPIPLFHGAMGLTSVRALDACRELVRWATQIELIGTEVANATTRAKMIRGLGSTLPYAMISDPSRWGDDLYRLCDRGYNAWPGILLTREELDLTGVPAWDSAAGSHGGPDMFSLLSDDVRLHGDAVTLRRGARVLANLAVVVDQVTARNAGEVRPNGRGFTVDINDPSQLTHARVAQLLGSKDDRANRQLRVTDDGIAYLSDVVGNIGTQGHAMLMETWIAGNGYVGIKASQDRAWVDEVLQTLKRSAGGRKGPAPDFVDV